MFINEFFKLSLKIIKKHILVHTKTAEGKYMNLDSKNYQQRECSNDLLGVSFILQKKGKGILIGYNLNFFIHS